MQPLTKAQARFYGVAKRVAEIQDGPQTRLSLILPHHESLDFTTALHSMRHGPSFTGLQGSQVDINPIKKRHVGDGSIFDDFGQASAEFACWQSFQNP